MEEITARLEEWQKEQLQEVADGMLKIYRTLARMQFIDDHIIEEGPHDLENMLSVYRELNIDDSIIYLYSILPYVNEKVGFFQRGETLDLRDENDMDEARNPMYDDDSPLRPWMTALSSISNHDVALIYDAERHVIGMFAQEYSGSTDPRIRSPSPYESSNDGVEDPSGSPGEDDDLRDDTSEKSNNESRGGSANDEEAEGSSSADEDEESTEENIWDDMDARSAPKVLRDVVRWYENLTELPLNEDKGEWDPEFIRPLYLKYGWPSADFDAEGFLVEKRIREAVKEVEEDQEKEKDYEGDLEIQLRGQVEQNEGEWGLRYDQDIIDRTSDLETEWKSRYRMHKMGRIRINLAKRIQENREKSEKMPKDDSTLTEQQVVLAKLNEDLDNAQERLESLTRVADKTEGTDTRSRNKRKETEETEKELRIYKKAYQKYKSDEDVTPMARPSYYCDETDMRARLWQLVTSLETSKEEAEALKEFIAGMPEDVKEARKEAESSLSSLENRSQMTEQQINTFEDKLRGVGYVGWPLKR